jgi:periplasmic protein TonB
MDLRRVTAAAGAVGINALVAFAMVALSGNGPPSRPLRAEPVIARLVEPPPPEPPKPVAAPPRPSAEPVQERRAERPAARAADSRPAPQAKVETAAAPVRDTSAGDAQPTPVATPAAPAAAPAAIPVTPAAPAPAQGTPSAPAPTAAASAAPGSPIASAAPTSEATRRVGPRVDASWAGNAPPPYPAAARRMGEQGEVRLDVHVGTDGSVIDVQVRASSGSPALDRSAMDAVRRWRFRPATVDGQAVSEWYRDWKWVFRLEG